MKALLLFCLSVCFLLACSTKKEASGPNLDIILADKPAATLAEYGLFQDTVANVPADGVHSYELINPLFSDHALKDRLVFVPGNVSAEWSETDVFAFPVGTVLIKSFSYAETGKLETRLLIHKAEGWAAYPYVWDDTHTEARYRPIGARRDIEVKAPDGEMLQLTYAVPNQNQCKTCHQAGDDIVPIGPKARNLGDAQVMTWQSAGLLADAPDIFDVVPSIGSAEESIEARARAYLDINCAHCHKSDGAASNSGLWLTWDESNQTALGINKHPTAAGRGSGDLLSVIEPGAPDASILAYRMASMEAGIAMPELGRILTDERGVNLIRDWITELEKN